MAITFINGIPVANMGFGYLDSYFAPQQKHLRDVAEAQDVEYEEIYEQEDNTENGDN